MGNGGRPREDIFFRIDRKVMKSFEDLVNRAPCGMPESFPTEVAARYLLLSTIDVPVLLVFGEYDELFEDWAPGVQAQRFVGSDDVTLFTVPAGGHAFMLEESAEAFRAGLHEWLAARGFQGHTRRLQIFCGR